MRKSNNPSGTPFRRAAGNHSCRSFLLKHAGAVMMISKAAVLRPDTANGYDTEIPYAS